MPDQRTAPTAARMKREARDMRAREPDRLSHSQALEAVAKKHGFSDWNTASARASSLPVCPVNLGDRVAGRYLKQPFAGTVVGLQSLVKPGIYRVTIQFDEPVDVVTFDSFSAFRQRVTCRLDEHGVALDKTSNGVPDMVLDL